MTRPRTATAPAGQASVEWLALVALAAVLLAAGGAVARGVFLGRAVTREVARAICVVGGGDCARDREPCALGVTGDQTGMTVSVGVLRLGGRQLALVERRSDGTVAVTIGSDFTGGLAAGVGARFAAAGVSAGGTVEASVTGRRGDGATWIVPSLAAAGRLLADHRAGRLHRHADDPEPPAVRAPDITYGSLDVEGWAGVSADANAVVTLGGASGGLSLARRSRTATDHRTGHRTVFLQAEWKAGGEASARGVLGVAGDLAGGATERYAVELDAAGRPLDLQVLSVGELRGSADLPAVLSPVAGLLAGAGAGSGSGAGKRLYEVTAHLDLTDPAALAAARGLLAQVSEGRTPVPSAGDEVRRRLAASGTVEARVIADAGSQQELGGMIGAGLQAGLSYVREERSSRLVAAVSRGLDGQWLPRTDCLPDA